MVRAEASALDVLRPGLDVALVDARGAAIDARIRTVHRRHEAAIVELEGISDRNAAAAVVGRALAATRTELPQASEREIYECDVIGIEAYTAGGELLGTVVEILATGANDVWVVRGARGELLVPAVAHAVLEVDVAARRAIIDVDAALAE